MLPVTDLRKGVASIPREFWLVLVVYVVKIFILTKLMAVNGVSRLNSGARPHGMVFFRTRDPAIGWIMSVFDWKTAVVVAVTLTPQITRISVLPHSQFRFRFATEFYAVPTVDLARLAYGNPLITSTSSSLWSYRYHECISPMALLSK